MARLPVSGVTVATPFQDGSNPRVLGREDLQIALRELCPAVIFKPADVDTFYGDLCSVLGLWSAEGERQDSSQLAKAISGIQKDLEAVANRLDALNDGLHERLDIEIVQQLKTTLASNPEVGSRDRAEAFLASFKLDAERIAHSCLIAAQGLKMQPGKSGRPQHGWHDEFTGLLNRIAATAGIEPQLWRDREDGDWCGWLFDAARKLEVFFLPAMRARSDEAAGKRLDRSKARLGKSMDKTPARSGEVLSM